MSAVDSSVIIPLDARLYYRMHEQEIFSRARNPTPISALSRDCAPLFSEKKGVQYTFSNRCRIFASEHCEFC
jgi:hypothetical protein